jgi:hypothetical protein
MTHALKACKRDIKSLITAGGPVSGEWRVESGEWRGVKGDRQAETDIKYSVVMNSYSCT